MLFCSCIVLYCLHPCIFHSFPSFWSVQPCCVLCVACLLACVCFHAGRCSCLFPSLLLSVLCGCWVCFCCLLLSHPEDVCVFFFRVEGVLLTLCSLIETNQTQRPHFHFSSPSFSLFFCFTFFFCLFAKRSPHTPFSSCFVFLVLSFRYVYVVLCAHKIVFPIYPGIVSLKSNNYSYNVSSSCFQLFNGDRELR